VQDHKFGGVTGADGLLDAVRVAVQAESFVRVHLHGAIGGIEAGNRGVFVR
jgi:hypothetical protein